MSGRTTDAGFTLIESLVAMAVLAVGAVSLLIAAESHAARVGGVIDRTAARWVAETRLTELRLGLVPDAGPVETFGRRWAVTKTFVPTNDPDVARLEIDVALSNDTTGGGVSNPLFRLTGYAEQPADGEDG